MVAPVSYELSLGDLRRYVRYLSFSMFGRQLAAQAILAVLAIAVGAPLVASFMNGGDAGRLPALYARLWPLLAWGCVALVAMMLLAWPEIQARRIHAIVKGPITATLTPQGLHRRDGKGESTVAWTGLESIIDAPGQCLFVLAKGRMAANVVVVPRHAFSAPGDAQEFLAEARRLWQAARPVPPPA